MRAIKFSSANISQQPFSLLLTPQRRPCNVIKASSRGTNGRDHNHGRLVDENMIVLRMRIKEMRAPETSHENWTQWEKKYFVHYNEDVCQAVGLLQSYLMSVRPSLAIAMLAFAVLSVPISTGFVFFQAMEMAKITLSGFNLPG